MDTDDDDDDEVLEEWLKPAPPATTAHLEKRHIVRSKQVKEEKEA